MRNDKLPEENAESERTPDPRHPLDERAPPLMSYGPLATLQQRLDALENYYSHQRDVRLQAPRVARVAPTMASDLAHALPTIEYPPERITMPERRPLSLTFLHLTNPTERTFSSAAAAGTAANFSSASTSASVGNFSSAATPATVDNFSSAATPATLDNFSSAATPATLDNFSSAATPATLDNFSTAARTSPSISHYTSMHPTGLDTSHPAAYSSASSNAATYSTTQPHNFPNSLYCVASTSNGLFRSNYGSPTASNSDTDSATSSETVAARVMNTNGGVSRRRGFDDYNDEDMEEMGVPHKVAKRSEQHMMVNIGEGGGNLGNGGNSGNGGDRGDRDDGDDDMMMDCASSE